jgi:PAS domain S-box-containing protein
MADEGNKPFEQAVRTLSTVVFKRGMITAWITLIITLFVTIIAWYYTKNNIDAEAKGRFNFRVNETKFAITQRMLAYEQILRGGLGLFYSSNEVTREDWKNYINSLKIDENYPGILGIGFSEIVDKKRKDVHTKQVRSEGFPYYRIWPEGERDIYTSVVFLEPFNERNQRVLGYDMFSEIIRRHAMETSRDSGIAALSGKVTLVQETKEDIQAGFLLYMPLYDPEMETTTVENRRKAIKGFVYSPFRMNDLMNGILGRQLKNIKLEIFDDSSITNESLTFSSLENDSLLSAIEKHYFVELINININGRPWTLRFSSLPEFERTIDRGKPLIVLISGILISSLFFIVARNLSNIFIINNKLEQLLESTIEGIYGVDRLSRCTFINKSAVKMLGYEPEEFLKKDTHALIHYKKENGTKYPHSECPIILSMEQQKACFVDSDVFWTKDGTSFPVEYSAYPIIDNGEATGAVIAFTDITQRKKNLAQIEASLKEKEVLLREIHHRVKNNLQIISSMLNIQSSYITDRKSLEIFEESKNRVKSMALIHEKLYQNESLSRLNLKDYVKELVNNLMKSYHKNLNIINSEIRITEIFLNADTAIPLGLIINELVSNSLKYAFPRNKKGKILLSIFPVSKERFKMTIADNGVGLPKDFDINKTDTLGLRLVSSLVNQLDGEIKLNGKVGTQFEINFRGLNLVQDG